MFVVVFDDDPHTVAYTKFTYVSHSTQPTRLGSRNQTAQPNMDREFICACSSWGPCDAPQHGSSWRV
jgi:hypothetical protein